MNALARIAKILHQARMAGGWIDDVVASAIFDELGLDDDGKPVETEPPSRNLGHG